MNLQVIVPKENGLVFARGNCFQTTGGFMKIRNTIKSLALVGATAALLPLGSAVAGGPGFGGIVVNSGSTGTLSGCPANATCTPLITGEGFLQQEVTFGGDTYVQTVIIDPLTGNVATNTDVTTLAFSDITFIQMAGSSNGIKGLQTITDDPLNANPNDTTGNLFTGTTELLIGTWAADVGKANVNITQAFRDNGGTGTAIGATGATQTEDDFVNSFSLGLNLAADGSVLGKAMDMTQDVGMSDPTVSSPGNDFQRFVIRQRSGDLLTGAGSLVLDPVAGSAGTGGTATWAAPDDVMVAWLGQRVSLGGLGASTFGFQSVNDVTDDVVVSTFSTSSADVTASPFAWDATNFGDAPVLPQ